MAILLGLWKTMAPPAAVDAVTMQPVQLLGYLLLRRIVELLANVRVV